MGFGNTKLNPTHSVIGAVVLLFFWEIAGRFGWAGVSLPAASEVLEFSTKPGNALLLWRSTLATLGAASLGFVIGIFASITAAFLSKLWPASSEPIGQGAALLNAIPTIALGPVFTIAFSPQSAPTAIAAIASAFPIFVNTIAGLASAHGRYLDLAAVYGTHPGRRAVLIEFPHALPAIATGLKAAAPAALIGAIVGEWFGAGKGLGLVMISSMQNFQITLLWSAVVATLVISLSSFLGFSTLERIAARRFG